MDSVISDICCWIWKQINFIYKSIKELSWEAKVLREKNMIFKLSQLRFVGQQKVRVAQRIKQAPLLLDHISGEIDEKCEQVLTQDGGRAWRCLCCGKEFGAKSSCTRHIETLHYATPSLNCELCGKVLKNKNSHQNHMIMVHGHKKRM